ncbi:unnamed protein product, partial [Polarella glacialis]
VLRQFMETMHRAGARNFLVSGVPVFLEMPIWNLVMPVISGMVNSGQLEDLGIGAGDPPRLAVEIQAASLHDRWEHLCKEFGAMHTDTTCAFFDE